MRKDKTIQIDVGNHFGLYSTGAVLEAELWYTALQDIQLHAYVTACGLCTVGLFCPKVLHYKNIPAPVV